MAGQNTGLRLENTTADTITVSLLEQGQSGDNVPIPVTQASNGIEEQVINPTNAETEDNPWYVIDGVSSLTDEYENYSSTSIALINEVIYRRIEFNDGDDTLTYTANATLQQIAEQTITLLGSKNGVAGASILSVNTTLQMKKIGSTPYAKIGFQMNYKVNPDTLTYLISAIKLGVVV
jgi:hypothetical protein